MAWAGHEDIYLSTSLASYLDSECSLFYYVFFNFDTKKESLIWGFDNRIRFDYIQVTCVYQDWKFYVVVNADICV